MRIFTKEGLELETYDSSLGWVRPHKRLVKHHPAVDFVQEVFHYEVIAQYSNGGRDLQKVVDIPGVEASPAWDEYEDILLYTPYTEEALQSTELSTPQEDMDSLLVDHEYRLTLLELGVY